MDELEEKVNEILDMLSRLEARIDLLDSKLEGLWAILGK